MNDESIMIAATDKVLAVICVDCRENVAKEIDISDIIGSPNEHTLICDVVITYLNDLISDAYRLQDGTGINLDDHPKLTESEAHHIGNKIDELIENGAVLETNGASAIFAYIHKTTLEHARDRVNSGDYIHA